MARTVLVLSAFVRIYRGYTFEAGRSEGARQRAYWLMKENGRREQKKEDKLRGRIQRDQCDQPERDQLRQ